MAEPGTPLRPADLHPFPLDAADAPLDLEHLADQLTAIAKRLREGDDPNARNRRHIPRLAPVKPEAAEFASSASEKQKFTRRRNARIARAIYDNRRKRDIIFGSSELFGEPAWDILLDLYIAEVEGKAVSVSSACIGSASPSTTGLRWLGVLCEAGFVKREHDPADQRRVLVRLSEGGMEAMDRYFAEAQFAP